MEIDKSARLKYLLTPIYEPGRTDAAHQTWFLSWLEMGLEALEHSYRVFDLTTELFECGEFTGKKFEHWIDTWGLVEEEVAELSEDDNRSLHRTLMALANFRYPIEWRNSLWTLMWVDEDENGEAVSPKWKKPLNGLIDDVTHVFGMLEKIVQGSDEIASECLRDTTKSLKRRKLKPIRDLRRDSRAAWFACGAKLLDLSVRIGDQWRGIQLREQLQLPAKGSPQSLRHEARQDVVDAARRALDKYGRHCSKTYLAQRTGKSYQQSLIALNSLILAGEWKERESGNSMPTNGEAHDVR